VTTELRDAGDDTDVFTVTVPVVWDDCCEGKLEDLDGAVELARLDD